MTNSTDAKPLSAVELARLLDDTRRSAGKVVPSAAIFLYDMALERAIKALTARSSEVSEAAVEAACLAYTCDGEAPEQQERLRMRAALAAAAVRRGEA